jgi:hypothetical protein
VLDYATSEVAIGSKRHRRDEENSGRRFQLTLAAAHQDGCRGEGESGKIAQGLICKNCDIFDYSHIRAYCKGPKARPSIPTHAPDLAHNAVRVVMGFDELGKRKSRALGYLS